MRYRTRSYSNPGVGKSLGQPWPPDLLQLTYAAAGGPLGSRPGGCPGRPMACHWATGLGSAYGDQGRASGLDQAHLRLSRRIGLYHNLAEGRVNLLGLICMANSRIVSSLLALNVRVLAKTM